MTSCRESRDAVRDGTLHDNAQGKTCGICHCGAVWGGGPPKNDLDVSWVVLETIRKAGGAISRTELSWALERSAVYAEPGDRDEVAVKQALDFWNPNRIRVGEGKNSEPTYTFIHRGVPRKFRRVRSVLRGALIAARITRTSFVTVAAAKVAR